MKIAIPALRPRNPWVAPAMLRRAGAHRTSGTSRRQHLARALRRELNEMKRIP
jgi:hypothetical protein